MTAPPGDDPGSILADPRIESDHLRSFVAEGDPLLVVGAVHDHPASAHRARLVVERLEPDVVGVELPGLALPLFERRAAESRSQFEDSASAPALGEFGAALAAGAAVDARSVPIDTLDWRFARSLWRELRDADPAAGTVKRILGAVSNVSGHAVSCRMAASLGDLWPHDPLTESRLDYDVSGRAPAKRQADHEREQLSRSLSILRALERPVADDVVDAARERTMAANLARTRSAGGAVAVVGFDHLDGIAGRLRDGGFDELPADRATLSRCWR